jgi:hypothetical protein
MIIRITLYNKTGKIEVDWIQDTKDALGLILNIYLRMMHCCSLVFGSPFTSESSGPSKSARVRKEGWKSEQENGWMETRQGSCRGP